MDEVTAKDRRRLLDFAEKIATLAAETPDELTKNELYRAANSVRRRFGWTDQEKLEEIYRAIELGAMTVTDLVRETAFPPAVVHWATRLLEDHKVIKSTKFSAGNKGRPALMFKVNEDTGEGSDLNTRKK